MNNEVWLRLKVNVSTKYSDYKRFNVETPANGAQPRYVQQGAAQDLAGDRFTALHTWEWLEMQLKTGQAPVYRYRFDETLPLPAGSPPDEELTAPHAGENWVSIRDAFG
jgi:hypothetical protein